MRAVVCKAFKGIEALDFAEIDEPRPAANEVLVDVHAASVSYMDYLMSSGGYQMRPALPYVPGTDAAGIVLACGERVTRFRPGDRVSCGNWFGAFAERMVAKESSVAMLPANVDFTVGSTVRHTYLTAWYALIERARLQAGETVLVTGAAGGVGLACVEIAHLMGARVIAVVGSAAKAALARTRGAAEVVDHSCEDVRERVKALAGSGLDICADNVGGALFATLARFMMPSADSPLAPLTQDAAWQRHARFFDSAFGQLEQRQISKIRAWADTNLAAPRPTMRPWEFSAFRALRRIEALPPSAKRRQL